MGCVRFIGCLHLGHEGMAKYHRGFKNSEMHDEYLKKQWNSVVSNDDIVYILGDVAFETSEHYHKLGELNGAKRVVLGNHDLGKHVPELLKYVDTVSGMIQYKGFWLTHAPLHPMELLPKGGNIHAHIHTEVVRETTLDLNYWGEKQTLTSGSGKGYYNVDAHLINYKPVTISELLANA